MSEAVNHPAHYGGADNPYEAIKVIEAWGLGFCLGNTVKYISRAGKKDALLQDLKRRVGTSTARFPTWRRAMYKIDVLDHGFVRLVEHMGSDLSVVRAARVSYDAAWRAGEDEGSDARLIRYLWKNHHTSPFEAVEFQFEVKAPIFVLRQWHRHRTWSYNELSARYRELPEEFYVPDPEKIGAQSTSSKQARGIEEIDGKALVDRRIEASMLRQHCEHTFAVYRELLRVGWPRELARSILPVATYSHMFAKVDLRNLLGFLDLRCHPHAQYEIRVYAEAMRDLARQVAPVCMGVWEAGRG